MSDILDFLRRLNESVGGTLPAWGILLRVTLLLSAALLVALVLRRASAALRHLVWTLSLVGTLLVPLCSWVLPAWQWAVLPQRQPSPPSVAPVVKDAPPSPLVAPRREDPFLRPAHSPRPLAGRSPLPAAPSADQPVEVPTTPPATVADHPTPPPAPQPKWSWPMLLGLFQGHSTNYRRIGRASGDGDTGTDRAGCVSWLRPAAVKARFVADIVIRFQSVN